MNTETNLYLIQDDDRPMHVIADSWIDALERWKKFIAEENALDYTDVDEPTGIMLVCESRDLMERSLP